VFHTFSSTNSPNVTMSALSMLSPKASSISTMLTSHH
jgi:hypothetical protein